VACCGGKKANKKKVRKKGKKILSGHAKKGCHPVVISLKIKLPVVMVLICLFSFQVIHKNEFEFVYSLNSLLVLSLVLSFFLLQLLLHISQSSFSVDLNERMFN
jgi:hypothetical protein